ncbi:MAG: hypothetical protein E4H20_07780 [Spirochaetales bacterium]|nr:MAG: hypothetical protein E4H20_07780 [Spirochaetales bacterium]
MNRLNQEYKIIYAIISLTLVFVSGLTAQEDRVLVLTVLPFKTTAEPAYQYLGDSFSEAMTTKLVGLKRVKIYERSQFEKLSAELRLEKDASGMFDPETLARTGAVISIDYAFLGSVTQAAGVVSCNVRLVHVNSGKIVLAREIRGTFPADLFKVQDEAARAVINALAIKMDDLELKRFEKRPTEDPDAYQLYNRSLSNNDAAERIKLLESALGRDPTFTQAGHLLADAYIEIGRPERALSVYRLIMQVDPWDYRASYNLALLLFDFCDYSGSREMVIHCVEFKPGDADAIYQLGLTYEFNPDGERYGSGSDLASALARYTEAAALDSKHAESRLAGGMLSAFMAQAEPEPEARLEHLKAVEGFLSEYLVLEPECIQAGEIASNLELIRISITEHEEFLCGEP